MKKGEGWVIRPMDINLSTDGWGSADPENIYMVLKSVQSVFIPCFGIDVMNPSPVTICHLCEKDSPRCLRDRKVIYLNVSGRLWSKFAYQFAHEYCHYQIPQDVASSLRWFEESICELASYYFMPLISDLWIVKPPYPNWREYAPHFREYALADENKAEAFELDFSKLENPTIEYLERIEYDRLKNAFVARQLKPIFLDTPTLWSEIPLLCNIPLGLPFRDAMSVWNHIASVQHQDAIARIAKVFSLVI